MEVVRLDKNVPIKAIPEQELNRIIIDEFTEWVANLLSLTDEVSADRLMTALPAVKEHCWSMGFSEIKKMFEMYADNKLSIEPIPNYFDRILFGKIVAAYKQQRKPKVELIEKPSMSQQEINQNALDKILLAYDEWKEKGDLPSDYSVAFDRLYDLGILPDRESSEKIKKAYHGKLCRAHLDLIGPVLEKIQWAEKNELKDTPKYREYKKRYHELNDYNNPEVQSRFRCLVLMGFFKKTTKESLRSMVNKALEEYN